MNKDFNSFISTLKNSIKTWDYFVNWNKVFKNSSEMEITLNKLNYLLGKESIKEEFKKLYSSNPDIIKAFPVLLAVRENKLEIYDKEDKTSQFFDFSKKGGRVEEYYEFFEKSGIISLFKDKKIKNLVDYSVGVEVGLDSNGRKNRGGKLMESIVEAFVVEFCGENKFEYLVQANATKIKKEWNIDIRVNKSERNFDFAIFNPESKNIKLIETNFYNGGGSKLKAVCGEFKSLHLELKAQSIDFIWITDGLGWRNAKKPLEETYNVNDYIFNLTSLENGVLKDLNW
ncbi:MAG: type II restriction endonuclease [Candidatus Paceibacterota bacterium]|jgi:hypothetical protein